MSDSSNHVNGFSLNIFSVRFVSPYLRPGIYFQMEEHVQYFSCHRNDEDKNVRGISFLPCDDLFVGNRKQE